MTNILTIRADMIRAALAAVSYDKGRDYLHGVHFDARGWIAATNGRVLFAARVPGLETWSGRGNTLHGLQLAQAVKGKCRVIEIQLSDSGAMADSGLAKTYVPVIDGAFPSWDRVIPAVGGQPGDKVAPAHFLPDPIKAIHAMGKALGATAYIVPSDPNAPHPVVFQGENECFAVVMSERIQIDPVKAWAQMVRP